MRLLLVSLCCLLMASAAQAGRHRTFVASDGVDSGECDPTAACRTLAYALSQTNSEGEIIIVKSGGYGDANGSLTIDKSVSVIAEPGIFAALSPTTGNIGVNINTPGIQVALRGLTITGRGGTYGINLANGARLDLDNVAINNFIGGGIGLYIGSAAQVTIKNSNFRKVAHGIWIGAGAQVLITGTKLIEIQLDGIMNSSGTSGTTSVVAIRDTQVRCADNSAKGYVNYPGTGAFAKMYLDQVAVNNCQFGLMNMSLPANSANIIAISNSFVTGNTIGMYNYVGNMFISSENNHIANNGTDAVGTITLGEVFK